MIRREVAVRVIIAFYGSRGMPLDEIAALVRWHCDIEFDQRDVKHTTTSICLAESMAGNLDFFDNDTGKFDIDSVDEWLINQTLRSDLSRSRLYQLIYLDEDAMDMLFDVSICKSVSDSGPHG